MTSRLTTTHDDRWALTVQLRHLDGRRASLAGREDATRGDSWVAPPPLCVVRVCSVARAGWRRVVKTPTNWLRRRTIYDLLSVTVVLAHTHTDRDTQRRRGVHTYDILLPATPTHSPTHHVVWRPTANCRAWRRRAVIYADLNWPRPATSASPASDVFMYQRSSTPDTFTSTMATAWSYLRAHMDRHSLVACIVFFIVA